MGKLEELPRAVPADQLQKMLKPGPAFCSWDATYSTLRDMLSRWPFVFSHPLSASAKPAH